MLSSSANNTTRKCDTCKAVFEKTEKIVVCACKRFKFCNNVCYSDRPMRSWHKKECDKKAAERIAKDAERKAAAISLKRSEAIQNQTREPNGQFGNKNKSAKDEEAAAKNRLNSATSKIVRNIREEGQNLHELRKPWQIRFLVYRNEKGCKTDPIIFQSNNFNSKLVRDNVNVNNHELDSGNTREIDLSYEETEEDEDNQLLVSNQRKPTYRCYICQQVTGPYKGFVCVEKEENQACLNGAACLNCINLDMKRLSASERKIIKNNWRCPIHKSTSGRPDPAEEDLEVSQDLPKKKTKKPVGRRTKLLIISYELRHLMPEALRDKEHYTRTEITKGVHQYINQRPELKVIDPETKVCLVHPDDALAAVYGSKPFKGFSKIPQLKNHTKETGLYLESSQNGDKTPHQILEVTPAENVAATSGITNQISSPVLRSDPSAGTPISSPEDPTPSGSSGFRVPRKYLNPHAKRTLCFKAPTRIPAPPANAKEKEQSEGTEDFPAVNPEDLDETVESLPCNTCLFPLFKETEEMKLEPIIKKKKVIYCPGCRNLIHESCYLGIGGCVTCPQ